MIITFSLDDGVTWQEVSGIRVNVDLDTKDEYGRSVELHTNFTHEGIIQDVIIDDEINGRTCGEYSAIVDTIRTD